MAKLNKNVAAARGTGVLTAEPVSTGKTHEGGTGYQRTAKTELFLHATTGFYGEKGNVYESTVVADRRLRELGAKVAAEDWDWMTQFVVWLRREAGIRTASVVLCAVAVHMHLEAQKLLGCPCGKGQRHACPQHKNTVSPREFIRSVLERGDEPGEFIGFWVAEFGRNLPMPVKRGVADVLTRVVSQRAVLRYDKPENSYRFADLLELCHPRNSRWVPLPDGEGMVNASSGEQGVLFKHLINERHHVQHGKAYIVPGTLTDLRARHEFNKMEPADRHAFAWSALKGDTEKQRSLTGAAAGQHEWVMSWLGEGDPGNALSERERWSLVIPVMGYRALVNNLANFDKCGLKDSISNKVAARIGDPDEVKRGRMLPFQLLSAYQKAPSLRWSWPLEQAVTWATRNVPELPGHTLVLVDTSKSMRYIMSEQSSVMRAYIAALFAFSLAMRNPDRVDVWGFAINQTRITGIGTGHSILSMTKAFTDNIEANGEGTRIERAVRDTFNLKRHDRVICLTDMQTATESRSLYERDIYRQRPDLDPGDVGKALPENVPFYGFNVVGHPVSAVPGAKNRYDLGGLTDHTFAMIPALESGRNSSWPWE